MSKFTKSAKSTKSVKSAEPGTVPAVTSQTVLSAEMPNFSQSFVRVKRQIKTKRGMLVVGLPGVGFASKLAVDHLVSQLKAEHVATVYSPHFPNQVIATAKGGLRPFSLKFYHKKLNGKDVVFLRGDLQPLTVEGQYEVAAKALEYFHNSGGRSVLAMAGLVTQPQKTRGVYVSSTHKSELRDLQQRASGIKQNKSFIPIVGMAGLIPTLAPLYGLRGSCMLVETTGEPIDAVAAATLVEVIGKLVDKKIPIEKLKKKAEVAKQNYAKMMQQQGGQPEQHAVPGTAVVTDKVSPTYIR